MGRLHGKIGFISREDYECEDGIYESMIVEKDYKYEDFEFKQTYSDEGANASKIRVNTKISVLADTYAFTNWQFIKYVEYCGAKWTVESVTPRRPRLILTLGDLYNEG